MCVSELGNRWPPYCLAGLERAGHGRAGQVTRTGTAPTCSGIVLGLGSGTSTHLLRDRIAAVELDDKCGGEHMLDCGDGVLCVLLREPHLRVV
jgi:hypothetical protein